MLYFTTYVVTEYVTCTGRIWCYVLSCVVHTTWARTRGLGVRGRVVRMPRVAKSKGWKNEYFSYNFIFCAQQVFRLLSQIKINWISCRSLFEASNFCQGRPLSLFAPGVKNLATSLTRTFASFETWFNIRVYTRHVHSPTEPLISCIVFWLKLYECVAWAVHPTLPAHPYSVWSVTLSVCSECYYALLYCLLFLQIICPLHPLHYTSTQNCRRNCSHTILCSLCLKPLSIIIPAGSFHLRGS